MLTVDLSRERGASNWLTVLSEEEFGFSLHIKVPSGMLSHYDMAGRCTIPPQRVPVSPPSQSSTLCHVRKVDTSQSDITTLEILPRSS